MWSVSFTDAGTCHNYIAWIKETSVWSIIWIILTGEHRRTVRETSAMASLSTTNPTRTCLGSKAGPPRWEPDHRPSCQQLCRKVANKQTVKQCIREVLNENLMTAVLLYCFPWYLKRSFPPKTAWPTFSTADHKQSYVHIHFTAHQRHTNTWAKHFQSWISSFSSNELCDWLINSLVILSDSKKQKFI
jgi:hypothetical protein